MKTTVFLIAGFSFCAGLAQAGVVFDLNHSTYGAYQKEGASQTGTVTTPDKPIPSIDLGQTGVIQIPGISFPKPAFSIESRFFLRSYSDIDPNISEILAAFDCDYDGMGSTEGADFRVGGGYNFPLRPSDAYSNVDDWVHPDELTKEVRASLSRAISEFALGVGQHIWKEVYAGECIERNTWTHMVATWDGQAMRIYLNGHEATDDWRTNGKDLPAFIKDTRTVFIGAEHPDAWRHLDGAVDFVRIYDAALSPAEVKDKYLKSVKDQPCIKYIPLESPLCCEIMGPNTKIKFAKPDTAECGGGAAGYSFYLELCSDGEFNGNVVRFPLGSDEMTFADIIKNIPCPLQDVAFLRVVACNSMPGLGKCATAADTETVAKSASRPVYMMGQGAPVVNSARKIVPGRALNLRSGAVLFDCRGRKVFVRQNADGRYFNVKTGIYFTGDGATGKKIMITR